MRRRVFVTGFGPFASHSTNPSEELVAWLRGSLAGSSDVQFEVLDVSAVDVLQFLAKADFPRGSPDKAARPLFVCFGVDGSITAESPVVKLERFAYNVADFSCPDNRGWNPRRQTLDGNHPFRLETELPVGALKSKLNESNPGVRFIVSDDPGAFLCNFVYFQTLSLSGGQALFVHIPTAEVTPVPQHRDSILALLQMLISEEPIAS
eukprot:CAMPEP_0177642832 /NCGR_PEP_ID=MMETSP0447-20121125/7826_1 /TAXON_ID=0 /ORGANISM="Stygamoeba regulata, Strain BSH-02190019" /LENGTH=206 /DNA_ID=CAMNT_0019145075 /DNA_START=100 /DNA_END=716 /DNA_ORIENTATION=+